MSKLSKIITLTITVFLLFGCSIKKGSNTDSSLSKNEIGIKESQPIKLKASTSQDKIDINKEKKPNQQAYKVLTGPLEANRKIKELYLLQLKAIEFAIKKLEK